MGLWNDNVVISIKIYNFKGRKKYTLLSALKCITLKVVKKNRFMSLIFILRRFTEMGLLSTLKSP